MYFNATNLDPRPWNLIYLVPMQGLYIFEMIFKNASHGPYFIDQRWNKYKVYI